MFDHIFEHQDSYLLPGIPILPIWKKKKSTKKDHTTKNGGSNKCKMAQQISDPTKHFVLFKWFIDVS